MKSILQECPLTRDQPVEPSQTALLVVDVQNQIFEEQKRAPNPYFLSRLTEVVLPNLQRLIATAREMKVEAMYTVIENLTRDGRDRSLD